MPNTFLSVASHTMPKRRVLETEQLLSTVPFNLTVFMREFFETKVLISVEKNLTFFPL